MLKEFIAAESDTLRATLRIYLVRAGLAETHNGNPAAAELLNEVTVQALEHAERFRPSGQPRAWLLGIAANLIKRKQTRRALRNRREPLVRDLYTPAQATLNEDELFDRVATLSSPEPAQELEWAQEVKSILSLVSESDRQVLKLAVLHEMNGQEIAQTLEVTPGAARVRLHRALNRLRQAWQAQEQEKVQDHV